MLTTFAAILLIAQVQSGRDSAPPIGRWRGVWVRDGDSLPVTFDFNLAGDSMTGTFASEGLRVSGIPLRAVAYRRPTLHFELRGDEGTTRCDATLSTDALTGESRDGDARGSFALRRTPRDTLGEFGERDAVFVNGSARLAGTLLLPRRGGPLPAVVFLQGSGAEERSANRYLAEQFARNGIAALIYDKRGAGASTGDWRHSTLGDLAADADSALTWARQQPEINAGMVGIYGHSQGAIVGAMVAGGATQPAFLIASAAAGISLEAVERYSVGHAVGIDSLPPHEAADARSYVNALVHTAYTGRDAARLDSLVMRDSARPWFMPPPGRDSYYWSFARSLSRLDLADVWSRIHVPVLLLYGALDQRIPPRQSIEGITRALGRAGNRRYEVRVFPGADHTFRTASRRGGQFRWPQSPPDYLPTIIAWTRSVTRIDHPGSTGNRDGRGHGRRAASPSAGTAELDPRLPRQPWLSGQHPRTTGNHSAELTVVTDAVRSAR